MNIYLAIITTLLVLTQIIRVTQNHISLKRQEDQIKDTLSWLEDNDVTEQDFIVKKEVEYLLLEYLKNILPDDLYNKAIKESNHEV